MLSMESLLFTFFSAASLLAGIGVLASPSVIYAAVSLLLVFLSMAGLFVLNNADFLALVQVMVYAVGLTIVILFGVMLTGNAALSDTPTRKRRLWLGFGGVSALLGLLIAATQALPLKGEEASEPLRHLLATQGTLAALGQQLFTHFLLPFELASLLLLGAMVGALIIARRHEPMQESDADDAPVLEETCHV